MLFKVGIKIFVWDAVIRIEPHNLNETNALYLNVNEFSTKVLF